MLLLFNHTLIDPLILNFCGLGSFDTLKLPPVIYSKVTCHDKDKRILMEGARRSLYMVWASRTQECHEVDQKAHNNCRCETRCPAGQREVLHLPPSWWLIVFCHCFCGSCGNLLNPQQFFIIRIQKQEIRIP